MVGVMLYHIIRLGDGRGDGEGGGGEVIWNLKTIHINWSYCMDGSKGK